METMCSSISNRRSSVSVFRRTAVAINVSTEHRDLIFLYFSLIAGNPMIFQYEPGWIWSTIAKSMEDVHGTVKSVVN